MKIRGVVRPLTVSFAASITALLLHATAFAQQTVAFGGTVSTGGAAVYTVGLGGSPLAFTAPTLVNANPEPWSGQQEFSPAVSALAYASNTGSGYLDLIGSNAAAGDLYSLAGPSYATSTQLAGPQDCTTYPNSVGVESSGAIVGVGVNGCGGDSWISVFTSGSGWTRIDDLNTSWSAGTAPDAVVASGNYGAAHTGDALVLIGDAYTNPPQNPNKAVVVLYPQSAIASASCDGCGQVLVSESGLPLAAGITPVSLDISPVDSSLLIGTSDGSIWQLPFVTSGEFSYYGTPVLYACLGKYANGACVSSPGVTWGKIRAIQQSGQLYILASIPMASQGGPLGYIGLFTSNGSLPIQGPIHSVVVQNLQPTGIALAPYKTGTIPAASCIATPQNPLPNCDPLGDGVQKITIRGNTGNIPPGATITEQECLVPADPRVVQFGSCTGHTLKLKDVCPGLSDSTIIPDYMCGSGGVANPGSGFIIIAALAEQIAEFSDGIEVRTDSTSAPFFPNSPLCPQNVKLYTSNDHSQFETTFVEGVTASEWLAFCDPSGSLGPHKSIDGIGFALNLTSFAPNGTPLQQAVKFADFKFGNLTATIKQSSIRYPWEKLVLLAGTAVAKALVDKGHYDCASEVVYLLDGFARRHRADFLPLFSATVREPNPFGDITGRLANLYLTIQFRVEGKAVTWTDWPLAADPRLCHTSECNVGGMDK